MACMFLLQNKHNIAFVVYNSLLYLVWHRTKLGESKWASACLSQNSFFSIQMLISMNKQGWLPDDWMAFSYTSTLPFFFSLSAFSISPCLSSFLSSQTSSQSPKHDETVV